MYDYTTSRAIQEEMLRQAVSPGRGRQRSRPVRNRRARQAIVSIAGAATRLIRPRTTQGSTG